MLKFMTLAAAATIAFSTAGYAQVHDMPMTCDTVNLENLKADVKKAPSDGQKAAAQSHIGTATVAMQNGDLEGCVAAMQKARLAIDN